ncbi:hypothetical protein [Methanimicrococcus hongohii]|uniref:hypothetical protein n=1 Tax=Methanimicrococcus hongohii TaxID=3028295 RepID=UPI0029305E63|nr:hypothetical protein [Methanimicrococcus sp. Hf6]
MRAACICSFLRNPFAFANVLPLPSGLRCFYLQVCIAVATFRFVFPPAGQVYVCVASQVCAAAATDSCTAKPAATARRRASRTS